MNEVMHTQKKGEFSYNKLLIVLVVLAMLPVLIGVALTPSYSVNTENYDVGSNGFGDLLINWLEGESAYAGVLDENGVLQISPTENSIAADPSDDGAGARATLQFVFSMGGSEYAPPGTVKIKIPRYLFYGRDDLPLTDQMIDIPLVEAPKEEGTDFNYYFETGSDGVEYIVIQNFSQLPPTYTFEASLTWVLREPATVADGYKKEIQGKVEIDLNLDGQLEDTITSNVVEMQYSSHAEVRSVTKTYTYHYDGDAGGSTNVYYSWRDDWVDELKPANDGDYVYAITTARAEVYYATQPYTITFSDVTTDGLGGEVIGYCRYSSWPDSTTESGDGGDLCFRKTNTSTSTSAGSASHIASKEPLSATVTSPSATYDDFRWFYFLVKYPKSTVADGQSHTLTNTATATITGIDGYTDSKTGDFSRSYRYVYTEPSERDEILGFYPPRYIDNYKYGSRTIYGGINILENNDDGFGIQTGIDSWEAYYNYSFYFGESIEDYRLTLKEGEEQEDPFEVAVNPENYGQTNWTANFVDDTMLFGNSASGYELLEYGDYELTHLGVSSYSVYDYIYTTTSSYDPSTKVTTNKIGWQYSSVSSLNRPEIKVYYKTDGDWIYYGSIKFNNSSSSYNYTFTDTSGNQINSTSNSSTTGASIPLPKGTTGVRGTVESKYGKIYLNLYAKAKILSSEHVRNIIKDEDNVYLYNFSTAYSEDYRGNKYGTFDNTSYNTNYYRPLSSDHVDIIESLDQEKYGKVMGHYYVNDTLNRIGDGATHQNKWVTYENDAANRQIKANYTAYALESLRYDNMSIDALDVLGYGIINEQRIGTFYDLLPLGMTVDVDTIEVQMFNSSSYGLDQTRNEAITGTVIPSSYSFVENWQGSGRMMLIVKAVVPEDVRNYDTVAGTNSSSSNSTWLYTGMTLRFTGIYSWDSFYDYGTNITNTVAYKSGSGRLVNGYKDDASSQTSLAFKDLMSDLDQDGNPEETTIADTVYAQITVSANLNTASNTAFSKGVKTADMPEYVDGQDGSVIVPGGGYYTYRLRFASQRNTTTANLVLYDVLEDFDDGVHENWRGILQSVDVTQMIQKGINAKVYYSTKKNINLYENGKAAIDREHPADSILTDTSIWSLEPPKNMADVTAIAIDCSEGIDGNPYVLGQEESVVAILTMQAPTENVDTLVAKNAKALNASWWNGVTQQSDQVAHDHFTVFEWTQVGIKEVELDIDKESYVPSGTKGNPSIVQNGDILTYDIVIKNTGEWSTLTDVKVRDILPKEVQAQLDDIAYYFEGQGSFDNTILVKDSGLVQMTANGQTIDFVISQLLSGDVMHILIPTVVSASGSSTFENTASIVGFNDVSYTLKSQTTYHKTELGSLTIKKNVVGGDKQRKFAFKITLIDPNREMPSESEDTSSEIPEEFEENTENQIDDNEEKTDDEEEIVESNDEDNDNLYDSLNTTYSGIEFVNGIGYIYLSDGESKTITNIPAGYTYIVEEADYSLDGYSVESKSASGTIKSDEDIVVEFKNTYVMNPNTSDILIIVSIIAVLFFTVFIVLKNVKVRRYS